MFYVYFIFALYLYITTVYTYSELNMHRLNELKEVSRFTRVGSLRVSQSNLGLFVQGSFAKNVVAQLSSLRTGGSGKCLIKLLINSLKSRLSKVSGTHETGIVNP